jgi:hypothetical protein
MLANQVDLALCGFGQMRRSGSIGDGRQAAAQDAFGKDPRGTIKKFADGVDYQVPPTITDPLILDEITADLTALGYPARQAARC